MHSSIRSLTISYLAKSASAAAKSCPASNPLPDRATGPAPIPAPPCAAPTSRVTCRRGCGQDHKITTLLTLTAKAPQIYHQAMTDFRLADRMSRLGTESAFE